MLGVVTGSTFDADRIAPGGSVERVVVEGADGTPTHVDVVVHENVVHLARHGREVRVPAHLIDHHANIQALHALGCNRVLGLCSVGGLRADLPIGTAVIPDDILALGIAPTFFDDQRGHQVPAFDGGWRGLVLDAWTRAAGAPPVARGAYAQTSGPRFETPAEVRLLAAHAVVVGMTMASELILSCEAGLAYAGVCSIDNLANGIDGKQLVVADLERDARDNAQRTAATLTAVVAELRGAG